MSAAIKMCVNCDCVVPEFFSGGATLFKDGTRVEWGLCESCYHKGHRSRASFKRLNARISKAINTDPERYRVTA